MIDIVVGQERARGPRGSSWRQRTRCWCREARAKSAGEHVTTLGGKRSLLQDSALAIPSPSSRDSARLYFLKSPDWSALRTCISGLVLAGSSRGVSCRGVAPSLPALTHLPSPPHPPHRLHRSGAPEEAQCVPVRPAGSKRLPHMHCCPALLPCKGNPGAAPLGVSHQLHHCSLTRSWEEQAPQHKKPEPPGGWRESAERRQGSRSRWQGSYTETASTPRFISCFR